MSSLFWENVMCVSFSTLSTDKNKGVSCSCNQGFVNAITLHLMCIIKHILRKSSKCFGILCISRFSPVHDVWDTTCCPFSRLLYSINKGQNASLLFHVCEPLNTMTWSMDLILKSGLVSVFLALWYTVQRNRKEFSVSVGGHLQKGFCFDGASDHWRTRFFGYHLWNQVQQLTGVLFWTFKQRYYSCLGSKSKAGTYSSSLERARGPLQQLSMTLSVTQQFTLVPTALKMVLQFSNFVIGTREPSATRSFF